MKRILLAGLCLALILVSALWFYPQIKNSSITKKIPTPVAVVVSPAEAVNVPKPVKQNVLNLALPQKPMAMDPVITLPAKEHNLKSIFAGDIREDPVAVGGRLIVDEEKDKKPNAAVWDTVKGAEVGITIKTP